MLLLTLLVLGSAWVVCGLMAAALCVMAKDPAERAATVRARPPQPRAMRRVAASR
jgi:hypothetical protein